MCFLGGLSTHLLAFLLGKQAPTPEIKAAWVNEIRKVLTSQLQACRGEAVFKRSFSCSFLSRCIFTCVQSNRTVPVCARHLGAEAKTLIHVVCLLPPRRSQPAPGTGAVAEPAPAGPDQHQVRTDTLPQACVSGALRVGDLHARVLGLCQWDLMIIGVSLRPLVLMCSWVSPRGCTSQMCASGNACRSPALPGPGCFTAWQCPDHGHAPAFLILRHWVPSGDLALMAQHMCGHSSDSNPACGFIVSLLPLFFLYFIHHLFFSLDPVSYISFL